MNEMSDNRKRRSSNPVFRNAFAELDTNATEAMTINGVVNKTGFLLALVIISAVFIWTQYFSNGVPGHGIYSITIVCIPLAILTALVTVFKKEWAIVTAPVYAVLEGVALGVISSMLELKYPGIVIQAVGLTFGTFIVMLFTYYNRIIRATEGFKRGVIAATGGIAIFYFISFIAGFFGYEVPLIHEGGIYGIAFSVIVVIVAAMNLILDFDFIEQGVNYRIPKYMEWYSAFGLIVTLIWLYLEILRLLSKARSK